MRRKPFFPVLAVILGLQCALCFGDPLLWKNENLSSVEVLGTLRGVGTLVLINDQPRILTNSHLLQGLQTLNLKLPWRPEEPLLRDPRKDASSQGYSAEFKAQLEFDSPISDVAILAPTSDTDPSILKRLRMYAAGKLCNPSDSSCEDGFEKLSTQMVSFSPVVYTIEKGNREKLDILAPFKASLVPDMYLSGKMENALRIPIVGFPGVSGGGYFEDGLLKGMVTKIELRGAGEAYAIPIQEITKIISPRYFGGNNDRELPKSHWESNKDGYRLVTQEKGHELSMLYSNGKVNAAGGGDTGNGGGGDTGNGGANRKTPLWNLELADFFTKRAAMGNNPFTPSVKLPFAIDGKSASYFKVKDSDSEKTLFWSPTLAHYNWLQNHADGAFETIYSGEKARQELETARSGQKGQFYARLYKKQASGRFELLTDKLTLFDPMRAGALPVPDCLESEAAAPKVSATTRENLQDVLAFALKKQTPFSQTNDGDAILNLNIRLDGKLDTETPGVPRLTGQANIRIPKDLSSISYRRDGVQVNLTPSQSEETGVDLYQSDRSPLRAAVIYNDLDLSQVERIYFDGGDVLYELIHCEIGKECYR